MPASYIVRNPNFADDVIKYMGLEDSVDKVRRDIERTNRNNPLSPEQINSGEPTLKERLNALIDRIEFIGHLDLLSKTARDFNYFIGGQEITGVQWDIRSLRIYLAITCIDIFCEPSNHRTHFENVFSEAPETIKNKLQNDLVLLTPDSANGSLKEIGIFFYNVRNYYTHSGRRFHINYDIPRAQLVKFKSGSIKHKKDHKLYVEKDINLIELIQSLALHVAKRRFGWAVD